MHATNFLSTGRPQPQGLAAPGWTDLNAVLPKLFAGAPGDLSFRCEGLPFVRGGQEEWAELFRALFKQLLEPGRGRRYIHVQCSEDPASRENRFILSFRCNEEINSGCTEFYDGPASALASMLDVQLQAPATQNHNCSFTMQFPGKHF